MQAQGPPTGGTAGEIVSQRSFRPRGVFQIICIGDPSVLCKYGLYHSLKGALDPLHLGCILGV